MLSSILTLTLLSSSAFAAAQEKRQATNGEQFTNAANQLISAYIPSSALTAFESAISEGAKSAGVEGDAKDILYSALREDQLPDWFVSAVPIEFSTQVDALGSNIDALRGTVGATLVPVVIAVTTTDSDGKTVVNTITTEGPTATGGLVNLLTTEVVDGVTSVYSTAVSGAASVASHLTTKVVDGVTSVFSTAISGASSVAGDISSGGSSVVSEISSGGSSVVSQISSGGSSVVSEISSGGSSVVSQISSGGSSVVSEISSVGSSVVSDISTAFNGAPSTTSSNSGAAQTAFAGAAAGALGFVGIMIAL